MWTPGIQTRSSVRRVSALNHWTIFKAWCAFIVCFVVQDWLWFVWPRLAWYVLCSSDLKFIDFLLSHLSWYWDYRCVFEKRVLEKRTTGIPLEWAGPSRKCHSSSVRQALRAYCGFSSKGPGYISRWQQIMMAYIWRWFCRCVDAWMRGSWWLAARFQRAAEARQCMSGSETLHGAPEWVVQESVKVNATCQWRPQDIGDARNMIHPLENAEGSKWGFFIHSDCEP